MASYQLCTFYRFFPIPEEKLSELSQTIEAIALKHDIFGLFLIGTEGVNTTVSGLPTNVEPFKKEVQALFEFEDLNFKDSFSHIRGFEEFKIKSRKEIVTLGREDIVPDQVTYRHLSPEDWNRMSEKEDVIVLDTRNTYEVEVGKFSNAKDLEIEEFRDFPEKLKTSDLPKDKTYLIYCTGGIRCEKAIYEMQEQGYKDVYQLDGGILNYLEKCPEQKFDGECFVFDYRVAVDQKLKPTETYSLCPHCGQPAKELIECTQCGREEKICYRCEKLGEDKLTCSKNCAHHKRHGHKTTKPHLDGIRNR